MRLKAVMLFCSIAWYPAVLAGQSFQAEGFTVALKVDAGEGRTLGSKISSWLGRELRDIGDTRVTDSENSSLAIKVVAAEMRLPSGTHAGWMMSILIEQPMNLLADLARESVERELGRPDPRWSAFEKVDVVTVVLHQLHFGPDDRSLREAINGIVAFIDADVLEVRRKLRAAK